MAQSYKVSDPGCMKSDDSNSNMVDANESDIGPDIAVYGNAENGCKIVKKSERKIIVSPEENLLA